MEGRREREEIEGVTNQGERERGCCIEMDRE